LIAIKKHFDIKWAQKYSLGENERIKELKNAREAIT
jgi:hypothetical protein